MPKFKAMVTMKLSSK